MIWLSLLLSLFAQAEMKHEHGVGELYIGVAGKKLAAILTIPADCIIGFEYEPKSTKDIEIQKQKTLDLESSVHKILKLDESLKCQLEKANSLIKREHNHGEYALTASLVCEKEIQGTKLKINFKDYYSKIKKINLNLVTDKKSQAISFAKGQGEIVIP
ncbi:MAG: ZrgA family zinc uptake protein [Bacteriovoracaceae bacterium]